MKEDEKHTTTDRALSRDPSPWLSLVGIGEGGWEALSEAARRAVGEAELLVGGRRHLSYVPEAPGQQRMVWPSPIQQGIDAILERAGRPVCVLASGDPFWFGIGATLCRYLPPSAMRTFPAPSAFSLAAARMGWPLQSVQCLSLVARAPEAVLPSLAPNRRLLVLSENGDSPAQMAALLCQSGYGASTLTVLENLGGCREAVHEGRAEDWLNRPAGALNTLAIECRLDTGAGGSLRVPGRHEDDFSHDGQITKREVRAVILALLGPRGGEHLWDIGAGSGSVAVEWLLADPANQATALEPRSDRLEGIRDNARRHGAPHLQAEQGEAPGALSGLASPDAIFIGGGVSGDGVIERCWDALSHGGRLVAAAVTLEAEAALMRAQSHYGGQLTRLSVDRAEPLGRFTGWRALRPITLWQVVRAPSNQENSQ